MRVMGMRLIGVGMKKMGGGEGRRDLGEVWNVGLGFWVLVVMVVLYGFR